MQIGAFQNGEMKLKSARHPVKFQKSVYDAVVVWVGIKGECDA